MAARNVGSGRKAHSAAAHLIVFALIIATPLLLLVGVLLYRSVSLESERVSQRIEQVLEALISDIDRDTDRRIAILETLSTSTLLAEENWPAFYAQAKDSLRGRAYLVLIDRRGPPGHQHLRALRRGAGGHGRSRVAAEDAADAPAPWSPISSPAWW